MTFNLVIDSSPFCRTTKVQFHLLQLVLINHFSIQMIHLCCWKYLGSQAYLYSGPSKMESGRSPILHNLQNLEILYLSEVEMCLNLRIFLSQLLRAPVANETHLYLKFKMLHRGRELGELYLPSDDSAILLTFIIYKEPNRPWIISSLLKMMSFHPLTSEFAQTMLRSPKFILHFSYGSL